MSLPWDNCQSSGVGGHEARLIDGRNRWTSINVIQDLYQVMVQVTNYDQAGRPSKEVIADQL